MHRMLNLLFALVCFAAIGAAVQSFAAPAESHRYLLTTIILDLSSHSNVRADNKSECDAMGRSFLDAMGAAGMRAGVRCDEILPGTSPQFKKERDS